MITPGAMVSSPIDNADSDEIDLRELLSTLLEARWPIASFALVALLIGSFVACVATPIYQVDGIVQVEDSNAGGLTAGLGDISDMFDGKVQAVTEIELLRSRMVLGKTVDDLQLELLVKPKFFPVIGRMLATGPDPVLQLGRFEVPRDWLGEDFTLVAEGKGTYRLEGPDDELLGRGRVGEVLSLLKGQVQLFVRDLQAEPGQAFTIVKVDRVRAIDQVSDNLTLAEKGKLSGIVAMTFENKNPDLAVKVLNQIANNYVRQNVERKSAEAQQTLKFLDQQLPEIKKQLEAAEVRFNEYRARTGSVDITREGELLLQQSVAAETGLLELQQKRKELLARFTSEHPSVTAIDKQIAAIQSQQGQFAGRVDALPKTQQELLRLTRDLQVNQELYTQLTNNAQQLKVVRAGTVGNVRIVDYAELPVDPIKPRKGLIIAVALLLGLFTGVAFAFIRKALRSGVKDAAQIESRLGLSVLATVPVSATQEKLARERKKTGGRQFVLAESNPEDLAIESLRSLRTSLHFALIDAPNNIVMISGPAPSVGKSFISVNLAAVLASAGERVLLIDGDLRRGYLNEYFGSDRAQGLSEVIAGTLPAEQAIRRTGMSHFDYVATGALPPNPAELLLHPRFEKFMKDASSQYDRIIIDSPPVLAVTDGAIIGRHVGATLLVARFEETQMRELELSMKRFQQAGLPINGVLLNHVAASSGYGYGYGYGYKYAYAYQYDRRKD